MMQIGERLGQLIALGSPEGQTRKVLQEGGECDLIPETYIPRAFSMSSCFFLQEIQ